MSERLEALRARAHQVETMVAIGAVALGFATFDAVRAHAQSGNTTTTEGSADNADPNGALTPADCATRAVDADDRPTAGAHFINLRRVGIDNEEVQDLPAECDADGKRTVATYVQYLIKGKWEKVSPSFVITGNDAGVYSPTLAVKKFTPVKGPKNRGVRLGFDVSWDATDNSLDRTAHFNGTRMKYAHNTDGA